MKMSSRRTVLERGSVTQHRPQDVDPPAGEGDQGLSVLFAFSPLAIVESPGLWGAAQAGKGRLVEDPFKDLVATTHPAMVAHPLAGVLGRRNQSGVGGELVGAGEGGKDAYGDQELRPEDRSHPR